VFTFHLFAGVSRLLPADQNPLPVLALDPEAAPRVELLYAIAATRVRVANATLHCCLEDVITNRALSPSLADDQKGGKPYGEGEQRRKQLHGLTSFGTSGRVSSAGR